MIALAAAMLLLASAAEAPIPHPKPFDRACMDEYGRDLCQSDVRAKIRARFDLKSAEDLASERIEGVRVFMIDGYSADMPVVSVLGKRGHPPELEVRVARKPPKVMNAKPSLWTQEVARSLSRMVREAPERPGPRAPNEVLCLHAWTTVVEVIRSGKVTTRIRSACGDQPIFDAGYALSTLALEAFPGCNQLAADQYRNNSARLVGCASLTGKVREYAADVRNRFGSTAFTYPERTPSPALAEFFTRDATLQWAGGDPLTGRDQITAFWKAQTRVRSYASSVDGETELVRVTGSLQRAREGGAESARFTQEWVREDYVWRIRHWSVEPFKAIAR